MPISIKQDTVTENGEQFDASIVTFTNGAKKQLEDLQKFFNMSDSVDVVKLGISILQGVYEKNSGK